jgi:DNA (cytosine-5)-methyltransferase 1
VTFGSLFAGIGGFDLGLERAGMVCKWQVEIDPYARAVLNKHWPEVPKHDDVRTFPPQGEWGVDVICGGFPCQDISVAGKGAGLAGARSGLWYEYARIIGELRPRYVIVENVAALLARGMGTVLGDLSTLGYDAEWHVIPASAVGAPHRRDRLWIIAFRNSDSEREAGDGISDAKHGRAVSAQARRQPAEVGCECDVPDAFSFADAMRRDGAAGSPAMAGRRLHAGGGQRNRGTGCAGQAGKGACDVADADCLPGPQQFGHERRNGRPGDAHGGGIIGRGSEGDGWWSVEPDVGRVAHGVPARVDRLRCLGNAVVPQIVEVIGRAILKAETSVTR